MVQWLHAHLSNSDGGMYSEFAIDEAAENGHLDVVQWL